MVRKKRFACDWFQDLKLYNLDKDNLNYLLKLFPDVEIIPVNCEGIMAVDTEAEVYIGNRISEEAIQKMQEIRWVHFGSIGVDKLSETIIKDRKLTITNSRNTIEESVVASALALVFGLARGHLNAFYSRVDNSFSREKFDEYFNTINDIYNAKFTILGYGPIAIKFIEAIENFSNDINIVTRTVRDDKGIKFYTYNETEKAVKGRDFIVNFLPETDLTRKLVSKNIIDCFSENTFYVNVGRSSTNDESALLDGINNGKIAALALDVFSQNEEIINQLYQNQRVLMTPHVAAVSNKYWPRQITLLEHNIRHYLNDELSMLKNLVYQEGEKI
mgnify:CR=1 FL=1